MSNLARRADGEIAASDENHTMIALPRQWCLVFEFLGDDFRRQVLVQKHPSRTKVTGDKISAHGSGTVRTKSDFDQLRL